MWWLTIFGVESHAPLWMQIYDFVSGAGSDFGELTLIAAVILFWRKHTCNLHWWCWRRPHYQLDGSPYMVCGTHHPDDQMTVKEAMRHHIRLRHEREGKTSTQRPCGPCRS